MKNFHKKFIFIVSIVGLASILFSCRGFMPTQLTGTHTSDHGSTCCDTVEKNGQTTVHTEFILTNLATKLLPNLAFLSALIFSALLLTYFYWKCKFYLRAIRDRYGSFITLNYFTTLFSQGVLHAKTF